MRAKALQYLAAFVLALGFLLAPVSGTGVRGLDDCSGGNTPVCGG